jgi:hypothetical protein
MATPLERLNLLLAKEPYFGDRLNKIVAAAADWYFQDPSASSFVVLSVFRVCADKGWDEENKLANQELNDFISHVIPAIRVVIAEYIASKNATIGTLNKLALEMRDCFNDTTAPVAVGS